MRCNRKIACFAVTPRKKVAGSLNITKIWQLRRRENPKAEIAIGEVTLHILRAVSRCARKTVRINFAHALTAKNIGATT